MDIYLPSRIFRVEYVRAADGAVPDSYDCEAYTPLEALLDASWHFERAKREFGVNEYRIFDPVTGRHHYRQQDPFDA